MTKALDTKGYHTDKDTEYFRNYEVLFQPLLDREVKLLELGIYKGGSLLLWRDYFHKAIIAGLDISPVSIDDPTGRIRVYQGLQQDCALLDRIANEVAPEGFDVIIDDASHVAELTRISFWHLFEHHLKAGGVYIIEDWGTGYWDSWPDGKHFEFVSDSGRKVQRQFPNHSHGMVGFIKELVDECGMGDITKPNYGVGPFRASRFLKMQLSHGQVFIVKK